jgi:GT2 family glycosyltransferase
MDEAMDISIVIVTWNCKAHAEECLMSLAAQKTDLNVEVIVVDNASVDGTPDFIEGRFPSVRLIRSDTNLGFARANNVGIERTTGTYICLINPDVNVAPDCLQKMHAYMQEHPSIGLLGPKMLCADRTVGRSTMRFPSLWNSFCRAVALDCIVQRSSLFGGFMMRDFAHDHTREVDVLNGWFWMTRRNALEEVGVLDNQLFMYGDDLDWSRRFHKAEWKVVFFAEAEAVHYGGGTTARARIPFYIAMQRANLQYWKKHNGILRAAGFFLITCLHHFVRVVGYALVAIRRGPERSQAVYKVQRSFASILWLTRLGSSRIGEIR